MAEKFGEGKELAREALIKHTYVDDIASGGESVQAVLQISSQMDDILEKGGFTAKPIHYTSQEGSTSVLGVRLDKGEDTLSIPMKFNISPKQKEIHLAADPPWMAWEVTFLLHSQRENSGRSYKASMIHWGYWHPSLCA